MTILLRTVFVLALIIGVSGCKTSADIKRDQTLSELNQEVEKIQKNRADSSVSVEDIRADMLTLRGKLEEQMHRQAQTQIQLERLQNSFEDRLKSVEEKTKRLEYAAEAASKKASAPKVKDNVDYYAKGVGAFEAGQYAEAAEAFVTFLDQKPKGAKVISAQFLLGQSYQRLKDYVRAIDTYQTLRDRNKKFARIPEVILGQAESFAEMGDKETAKLFFTEIIQKYPKSAQAKVAKKALAR